MKIAIEDFKGFTTKERLLSLPSCILEVETSYYPKTEIKYTVFIKSNGNNRCDTLGIKMNSLSDAINYINKLGENET